MLYQPIFNHALWLKIEEPVRPPAPYDNVVPVRCRCALRIIGRPRPRHIPEEMPEEFRPIECFVWAVPEHVSPQRTLQLLQVEPLLTAARPFDCWSSLFKLMATTLLPIGPATLARYQHASFSERSGLRIRSQSSRLAAFCLNNSLRPLQTYGKTQTRFKKLCRQK